MGVIGIPGSAKCFLSACVMYVVVVQKLCTDNKSALCG